MDDIENFLEGIQLTDTQKKKAFILVDRVFSDFLNATNEMLDFAKKYRLDNPLIEANLMEKELSAV